LLCSLSETRKGVNKQAPYFTSYHLTVFTLFSQHVLFSFYSVSEYYLPRLSLPHLISPTNSTFSISHTSPTTRNIKTMDLKLYYEDLQNHGRRIADHMHTRGMPPLSGRLGGMTVFSLLGREPMVAREEAGAAEVRRLDLGVARTATSLAMPDTALTAPNITPAAPKAASVESKTPSTAPNAAPAAPQAASVRQQGLVAPKTAPTALKSTSSVPKSAPAAPETTSVRRPGLVAPRTVPAEPESAPSAPSAHKTAPSESDITSAAHKMTRIKTDIAFGLSMCASIGFFCT
jgi:hypothetical protein